MGLEGEGYAGLEQTVELSFVGSEDAIGAGVVLDGGVEHRVVESDVGTDVLVEAVAQTQTDGEGIESLVVFGLGCIVGAVGGDIGVGQDGGSDSEGGTQLVLVQKVVD